MPRDNSLFQQVCQPENLMLGFLRVKKNKGIAGADGQSIEQFEHKLDQRLQDLADKISCGDYYPGGYKVFRKKKSDGSFRILRVPSVRDRVVMSAVAQLLSPLAEQHLEPHSYGYRPRRGVDDAIAAINALRQSGYRYVVEGDIDDFFDNIPHDGLLAAVRAICQDDKLLALIEIWLSQSEPDGRGIAQGSPLSPLLANILLEGLDEAIAQQASLEQGKAEAICVRYADDFVILARSDKAAQNGLERAQVETKRQKKAMQLAPAAMRKIIDTYEGMMYAEINEPIARENTNWRGLIEKTTLRFALWLDEPYDFNFIKCSFIYS